MGVFLMAVAKVLLEFILLIPKMIFSFIFGV